MGHELSKVPVNDEHFVSQPGLIRHWSGRVFVHPQGGSPNPGNDTRLLTHNSIHENMYFRFIQVEGHWGYIEHVSSGKIVHPYGGSVCPGNNTKLVLHSDRHAAAMFTYDEETRTIQHRGGRYIHPYGGSANPGNNKLLLLHDGEHDGMRWVTVTTKNVQVPLYPYPDVKGRWVMINAFINPKTEHTYRIKYTVGRQKTKSKSTHHAWSLSVGAVAGFIAGLGGVFSQHSGFIENTSSETYSEEKEVELEIHAKPGKTVVTWQWVWGLDQWGDGWDFKSNILTDTESKDITPDFCQLPTCYY